MPANVRIMKEWQSIAKAVMPPDVHPTQYTEMRRAFFAGAHAMLGLMCNIADEAATDDAGAYVIEEVAEELREFQRGVSAGKF